MKTKIAVAGLLGILAAASIATPASAQCVFPYPDPGNPMIIANGNDNDWAYETGPAYQYLAAGGTAGGPRSGAGASLTAGGVVSNFCAPFLGLDPNDPTKEYTWIITGTSDGTVTTAFGSGGSKHTTTYSNVNFTIYEGSPENVLALPLPALPNAGIPANYADGTPILSGTITGMTVIQSRITSLGTWSSSVNGTANFTGGTMFNLVGPGSAIYTGTWCPAGGSGCLSAANGYSSRPKAKWDSPATVNTRIGTWGVIKQIYR